MSEFPRTLLGRYINSLIDKSTTHEQVENLARWIRLTREQSKTLQEQGRVRMDVYPGFTISQDHLFFPSIHNKESNYAHKAGCLLEFLSTLDTNRILGIKYFTNTYPNNESVLNGTVAYFFMRKGINISLWSEVRSHLLHTANEILPLFGEVQLPIP